MSNVTGGTFTCSNAQTHIIKAEDAFTQSVAKPDYIADAVPLQFLRTISTAKVQQLIRPDKDDTFSLVYTDKCGVVMTTSDTFSETATCEISGTEAGQQCETRSLDVHLQSPGYVIKNLKYRDLGPTSSLNEELSVNLQAEVKAMDNLLSRYTVSKLDSWKGTNANTQAPGSVSGTTTTIPATAWNPDLFGYLNVTKARNKMDNMTLLLGGLMEQALWKVEMESSTDQGAANVRKVKSLGNVWSDSFVTEDVLGAKTAFLVNGDAVAFAHQARYKNLGIGKERNVPVGKQVLTTLESYAYPGVFYDYILQESCVNGDDIMTGKLFFHGGWWLNPVRCTTTRTGVLKFVCG